MEHEFYERFPEITIPETIKNLFAFSDGIDKVPLNKINIFIGPNNSGKSYFIREVLKDINCIKISNPMGNEKFQENWNKNQADYKDKLKETIDNFFYKDSKRIFNNLQDSSKADYTNYKNFYIDFLENLNRHDIENIYRNILNRFDNYNNNLSDYNFVREVKKGDPLLTNTQNYLLELAHSLKKDCYIIGQTNAILITPFRGLIKELINHDEITLHYQKLYNFNLNGDSNGAYNIENAFYTNNRLGFTYLSGGKFYTQIKKMLLTDSVTRDSHKEFEDYLSANFFFGKRVSITPKIRETSSEQEEDIVIKIGDDNDLKLKDVGTGLQMIMLLTWPLFAYDNGMIFVEEPELFLHPKFQNQLMNVYATHERSKNFQFFIVTHSNHIIDAIGIEDKINLFAFEKQNPKRIEVTQTSYKDTKPYELLGVKPSSIALANGIIWVEGPSDRTYVNYWINLFKPANIELLEGYHYQVLFYGGSLIKHLSPEMMNDQNPDGLVGDFIRIVNINQNFLIIADSDKVSKNASLNKSLLKIKANIEPKKLWITKGRTIENYLSLELIKKVPAIAKRVKQLKNNLHFDQFDHIVYNLYIDRLKYSPNTGFVKADFAKNIINLKPDKKEFKFDIEEQVNNLLNMIYKWNDIDPKKMEIKENLI